MPPKEAQEGIRLESLQPQQLQELRQTLSNEIDRLLEGGNTLGRAANTYASSKKAVEQLAASSTGQAIMLPLTSSLYVSGAVDDVEKVLVDVGTGYYVEMVTSDAVKYYDRRIKSLQDNIRTVETTIQDRRQKLMAVQTVLADKITAASRS